MRGGRIGLLDESPEEHPMAFESALQASGRSLLRKAEVIAHQHGEKFTPPFS